MEPQKLSEILRSPRGHELGIGMALHTLSDADLKQLGQVSLTALVRSLIAEPGVKVDWSTVVRWVRAISALSGPDDPRRE